MSEYDAEAESALVEEEQVVSAAEGNRSRPLEKRLATVVSSYISGISLLVAVVALLAAFAADDWMEDNLNRLSDKLDRNGLQTAQFHLEMKRVLAQNQGRQLDETTIQQMEKTKDRLFVVEERIAATARESRFFNRVHYVLALAITLFQLATALAAVVGITGRHQLLYASVILAVCGLSISIVGVVVFLQ